MVVTVNPKATRAMIGILPSFVSQDDPRPLKEQIHTAYAHGGGWNDFEGFELKKNDNGWYSLCYPDDPPMKEMARIVIRDETLSIFEFSWVAIIQKDMSFCVAMID